MCTKFSMAGIGVADIIICDIFWRSVKDYRFCGANFSRGICSRRADAVIYFLLCTPQQWLTMLFSRPDNPLILLIPLEASRPHLIHGSLGSPESPTQMASRSVQPFVQGLRTWPTDRHTVTDRPRYSVSSNRPHLAIAAAMRPYTTRLGYFIDKPVSRASWPQPLCVPSEQICNGRTW